MFRKLAHVFSILVVLTMVLVACGGGAAPEKIIETVEVVKTVVVTVEVPAASAPAESPTQAPAPAPVAGGEILDTVIARLFTFFGDKLTKTRPSQRFSTM